MITLLRAQQSAFSLIHNPGNGKTFSLSSCFHSLILSFVSTHKHPSRVMGKSWERENLFEWEGEEKLENFLWAFFSWTSSSVVWGKIVLCSFAIRAHTRLEEKQEKIGKKEEEKAKIINLWSKWRDLLKFYAIFLPFTLKSKKLSWSERKRTFCGC